jgi:oligoribonuclease NrnB/cAMP/cGMP phosphodiesterase (DHH superfamily)
MLAWEYFFPEQPAPILLRYVQDVDLWQWKLPNSKELALYVDTVEFVFSTWEQLRSDLENEIIRADFIKRAQLLLKDKNNHIKNSIEDDAQLVMFEGLEILAINATVDGSFMGNALVESKPPMGIVWAESRDDIYVSLRSNGDVDVGVIAKKYGGGGHPKAAGFAWPLGKEKPWKIIKKEV